MTLFLSGCRERPGGGTDPSIVGTWIVRIPEAPFPMHLYVFHADGTVQQSNPDAGDPNTSDSNLMGAWQKNGEGFKARTVEFTADRATHKLIGKGEIIMDLKVDHDHLQGAPDATFYAAGGEKVVSINTWVCLAAILNGRMASKPL